MLQIRETLYGDPKKGKTKQWSVYVEGDTVTVEHGRKGGKLQTKDTKCTPKNVGKINETSPEEQAILEAEAKWVKQYDNKLYRHTEEEAKKVGELLPMLAIDGSKNPDKIKYPCEVQPNLDGVRCTVYKSEVGELKAISRQGKFYNLHTELRESLLKIMDSLDIDKLDGELYLHGTKLQSIVSYVRNEKKEEHNKLEFHIFDMPSTKVWSIRSQGLALIKETEFVKVVDSFIVESHGELEQQLNMFLSDGYKGIIARNLKGLYEYNHRSNDFIKVKIMQDSEALVIGCTEDKNGEGY